MIPGSLIGRALSRKDRGAGFESRSWILLLQHNWLIVSGSQATRQCWGMCQCEVRHRIPGLGPNRLAIVPEQTVCLLDTDLTHTHTHDWHFFRQQLTREHREPSELKHEFSFPGMQQQHQALSQPIRTLQQPHSVSNEPATKQHPKSTGNTSTEDTSQYKEFCLHGRIY